MIIWKCDNCGTEKDMNNSMDKIGWSYHSNMGGAEILCPECADNKTKDKSNKKMIIKWIKEGERLWKRY